MDKEIYSLVWNKSLRQIVAASELEPVKTGGGSENASDEGEEAAQTKLKVLIEVLHLLFDSDTQHATPSLGSGDAKVKIGLESNGHNTEWVKSLIPLLSAGLNDRMIAQELNISSSTLSRRISDLMSMFGVHTRFQLGLQIARLNDVASQ